jgi:hypothetical protein
MEKTAMSDTDNTNNCLHCHLLDAIWEYFDTHSDPKADREVIEALARVFADLMAAAGAKERAVMRSFFLVRLQEKLAFHDKDGTLRADYLAAQN